MIFHKIFYLEELAIEAEARKVLYSIYDIRKNESNIDIIEINKIEQCLCMTHFLAKEYEKVYNFNIFKNKSWNSGVL